MHLTCIYGESSPDADGLNRTSTMVRDALARATAHGPVPALVAGDFNATLDQLPCAYAFHASGWADLAHAPTCATAASANKRRIDLLLADSPLRRMATQVGIDDATGIKTHDWQWFSVPRGPPLWSLAWRPAAPLPPPDSAGPPRETAWRDAAAPFLPAMSEAINRKSVADAWTALEQAMLIEERRESRMRGSASRTKFSPKLLEALTILILRFLQELG